MEVPLSSPALLFPAIAILILGYVNRYTATANVIRTFKKDYDAGYVHTKLVAQLKILQRRIELSRYMLAVAVVALMLATLSMFLIFFEFQRAGNITFGSSIVAMLVSMILSLRETYMSNKSLMVEIEDIFTKESKKGT